MAVRDVVPPPRTTVVHPDDVAAFERWADQQRSHLAGLAEELRAALADAERVEAGVDVLSDPGDDPPPAAFLAVVDAALATATDHFGTEADRVRAEAAAVVTAADALARAAVAAVGGDVESVTRTHRGPRGVVEPRRPRRAAELWQALTMTPPASSVDAGGDQDGPAGSDDVDRLLAAEATFWRDLPDRRLLDRMGMKQWSQR